MRPLEKRKLLKEQFNKRIQETKKQSGGKIVSFKELGMSFESETAEWYKSVNNGGAKFE